MILKLFCVWRLSLFLVTYLGSLLLPKIANSGVGAIGEGKQFDFWASWAQWDGGHFYNIAQRGYVLESDFAFMPLYPQLVKFLNPLFGGNLIWTGLIISNLAFLLFLWLFFKWQQEKFGQKIAYTSLVTFLVFPTTFFAVAFYSEGFFLLLVVIFFLFLEKKNYLAAILAGSAASVTRLTGLFLVLAFIYSYLVNIKLNVKRIINLVFYLAIALLPIILWIISLFIVSGDLWKFVAVQSLWQREIQDPLSTIFGYFWAFVSGQNRPLNDYFDWGLAMLFLSTLILGIKKIPSSLWIFSMLAILIPASTGTLTSMPRYLLASIGAFVIIGQFLVEHQKLRLTIWTAALFIQAILATLFVNGYWVA